MPAAQYLCSVGSPSFEKINILAAGQKFISRAIFTVAGVCNETEYGCCHDDVTLARGPNLEGCGEPTCAGSLYGCCKDRKTIAFGPHYAGCERFVDNLKRSCSHGYFFLLRLIIEL